MFGDNLLHVLRASRAHCHIWRTARGGHSPAYGSDGEHLWRCVLIRESFIGCLEGNPLSVQVPYVVWCIICSLDSR